MNPSISVSIIFATYKRSDILRVTLDSFAALDRSAFLYEIIVVDNACDAAIKTLVEPYGRRIPIQYMAEPKPGKNAALITGLKSAKGELLVFTDDDVIADPGWLNALYEGVKRYPQAHLFGGKVLPRYPDNCSDYLKDLDLDHWFIRSAFAIADWKQDEGPTDVEHIWGPNMAVRRAVFESGMNFNPDIGPNGVDYAMGSETDFLRRAHRAGYSGIYLPQALVYHQIREEQFSLAWLKGRAYRFGKGQAAMNRGGAAIKVLGIPRYLIKQYCLALLKLYYHWALRQKKAYFACIIELQIAKGQIFQYSKFAAPA